MDEPASSDTENEASRDTENEASAEACPGEPRARRSSFRDLLLEARGEVEEGSVVAGEGPTAYLIALF